MAVTYIHSIESHVGKSNRYISNPIKTILSDCTQLVSSFRCAVETADIEFKITANFAKEIIGDYTNTGGKDVLAYHIRQAFHPNENLTPEQCHEIGKEFAENFLQGKYEYVIATHIDKKHLHNHIIFNATSFVDYKKFRSQPWKTAAKVREVSDRVCQEHGLSVLPAVGVGKSYKEWLVNKEGKLTWKDTIRLAIDEAVTKATNWNEFVAEMTSAGIEIKDGKHIAFRCMNSEQERFIRGKRIGEDYTKESIIRRISAERVEEHSLQIKIDKDLIYKTLTDGFLVSVPNKDCYVYFAGTVATLTDENIIVDISNTDKFTIFENGLCKQSEISSEQLRSYYGDSVIPSSVQVQPAEKEMPLSDYLKLRRFSNKEKLHRAAEAVAYCRTQGVIYYRDFSTKIKELKDMAYDTRHILINLDKTVADIKEVGKLLVTYQKYLPIKQEAERKPRFSRNKYEYKYHLELASFHHAERVLREMGINPDSISVDDLIDDIKAQTAVIREWESKADNISERIDKLSSARGVIDEFIGEAGAQEQVLSRSRKINKNNINL